MSQARSRRRQVSRRTFVRSTMAAAAATTLSVATHRSAPAAHTESKTDSELIIGEGEYRYRVQHQWPGLPDKYQWQTTHGVAFDRAGNLYVIHEGHANKPEHPSIFVFDRQGKYVRSFGQQFQGGGHGIEVQQEGDDEFLYVCAYQQVKAFAKLTLTGEVVWLKHAPVKSGIYAEGEDTHPTKVWGRNRFMPTNFAFRGDGGFYLTDGYGSFYIHQYDDRGEWQRHFGGPGEGSGTFNTPHGICIDDRRDGQHRIAVADRAHHTLQFLSLDGKYMETLEGFGLPANMCTRGSLMLVPELFARVTLLDAQNRVVARLGDDSARIRADGKHTIRRDPSQWKPGKFVHPHDACFDDQGNILVAEWVATGRVTRLQHVS